MDRHATDVKTCWCLCANHAWHNRNCYRQLNLRRITGLLKTCISSHQEGFQDPNKMFHFLYMGMSGLTADTQRAVLMGRVGVIPYRNDRQEWIKRECWWTWWYRWVTLWCGGEIKSEGGTGDGLRCCVWLNMDLSYGLGAFLRGPICLPSIIRRTTTISMGCIIYPNASSSTLHHPSGVFACGQFSAHQHSSTRHHHHVFHPDSMPTPSNNSICS